MSRNAKRLLQELRKRSERWFLKGLKHGVTPHVMGSLPDLVETNRQKCLRTGVTEEIVNATIDTACQVAYQKHNSRGCGP